MHLAQRRMEKTLHQPQAQPLQNIVGRVVEMPVERVKHSTLPAYAASDHAHQPMTAAFAAVPAVNRQMTRYMQKNGTSPRRMLTTDSTTDSPSSPFAFFA